MTPDEESSTPTTKVPTFLPAAARSLLYDDEEVRVSAKMPPETDETGPREEQTKRATASKKSGVLRDNAREYDFEEEESDESSESETEMTAAIRLATASRFRQALRVTLTKDAVSMAVSSHALSAHRSKTLRNDPA